MASWILLSVVSLGAGCSTTEPATQLGCEAVGGMWVDDGHVAEPFCNLSTDDGGEPCTDSSECDGWCQAPQNSQQGTTVEGTCSSYRTATECWQTVTDGAADEELCH